MEPDNVQCPNCGAPLEVERGSTTFRCSYCGASLQLKLGTSGRLMAVLGSIKSDTEIVARKALLEHLEEEAQALETEREQLLNKRDGELSAARPISRGILVALAVAGLIALRIGVSLTSSPFAQAPSPALHPSDYMARAALVASGAGLILWTAWKYHLSREWAAKREAEIALRYRSPVAALDARIAANTARRAEVKRELDALFDQQQ